MQLLRLSHLRRRAPALVLVGAALVAAGCGSSKSSSAPTSSSTTSSGSATTGAASSQAATGAKHSGTVVVLSAGSLDTVITKTIAPAFHAATGYTLQDTSGGSGSLAADIKNKVDRADVFVSASPGADAKLMGSANGDWVSWYASFASSPLVLGYYPKSRFAADLKSKPWYDVITMHGFRLGRTNPTQDPGGVLAAKALAQTAAAQHSPALAKLGTESSDEYAEDPEEADVLSGQLDAAFMYEADANSQKSPFVALTGVDLAGEYTVTELNRAPHTAAAAAFIRFLLGATGQADFKADQFTVVSPAKVSGSGVPSELKDTLGS